MYQHRQTGFLIIFTMAPAIVLLAYYMYSVFSIAQKPVWAMPLLVFMTVIMLLAFLSFYSMEISVSNHVVEMKMGVGLFKKTFQLSNIESVEIVKNRFWYGWGIRWIPGGILYNVSGLDAVELRFKDGKKIRLGTDDPQGLYKSIAKLI